MSSSVLKNDREGDNETVSLPKILVDRVRTRLSKSDFDSVSDYIVYVVTEVLNGLDSRADEKGRPSKEAEKSVFSEKEQEEVEERLKSLGYI